MRRRGIGRHLRRGAKGLAHHTSSKALKAGQWNKYRVEAMGDHMRVWVNGEACADVVDAIDQEGFIALQVHAFKGDRRRMCDGGI